jgi:alpha-2-macroglobulin
MKTLIRSVAKSLMGAIRVGMAILRAIFGEIRWTLPPWMKPAWGATRSVAARLLARLEATRQRNSSRFWLTGLSSLILIIVGAASFHWYLNRPQLRYVEVTGVWPHATELKPGAQIQPLRVFFTASAARLATAGKTVTAGITIEPPVDGVWKWSTDSELDFAPQED